MKLGFWDTKAQMSFSIPYKVDIWCFCLPRTHSSSWWWATPSAFQSMWYKRQWPLPALTHPQNSHVGTLPSPGQWEHHRLLATGTASEMAKWLMSWVPNGVIEKTVVSFLWGHWAGQNLKSTVTFAAIWGEPLSIKPKRKENPEIKLLTITAGAPYPPWQKKGPPWTFQLNEPRNSSSLSRPV